MGDCVEVYFVEKGKKLVFVRVLYSIRDRFRGLYNKVFDEKCFSPLGFFYSANYLLFKRYVHNWLCFLSQI